MLLCSILLFLRSFAFAQKETLPSDNCLFICLKNHIHILTSLQDEVVTVHHILWILARANVAQCTLYEGLRTLRPLQRFVTFCINTTTAKDLKIRLTWNVSVRSLDIWSVEKCIQVHKNLTLKRTLAIERIWKATLVSQRKQPIARCKNMAEKTHCQNCSSGLTANNDFDISNFSCL